MCLGLFCILVEGVTRLGFNHISHIASRIATEYRATLSLKKKGDLPSVLLVGNSLLLEGIDFPQLHSLLSGRAEPVRFTVESTQYFDWYFGLRRLFAEGIKPDVVVLCIGKENLISSRIVGDSSAYYLFQLADIPQIRRAVGYDLTQTSGLVLARFSLFYAGRSGLRNFLLNRADPAYARLLHGLVDVPTPLPPDQEIERIATIRLINLRTLCSSHNARFVFLLAPGFGRGEAPLLSAAQRSGTEVMVPIHINEFGRDMFRDGYHLNAAGARIFTDKVAQQLPLYLANR